MHLDTSEKDENSLADEKHGMSVQERKDFYKALLVCERQATKVANEQYPSAEDMESNIEFSCAVSNSCKEGLRTKFDVSEEQEKAIVVEGTEGRWWLAN